MAAAIARPAFTIFFLVIVPSLSKFLGYTGAKPHFGDFNIKRF